MKAAVTIITLIIAILTIEPSQAEDDLLNIVVGKAAALKLSVTFPNGKEVNMGNELTPSEVQEEPRVSWEADPEKFYTLVMVDPDAPSRAEPLLADVKHWLVVNIPGNDVSSGEIIASYMGSGPPQGTGLHRYILFVFDEGDRKVIFDEPPDAGENRLNWSLREFTNKYELGIGPIAGNYFQAQFEE